jgi:hypothetical protein
MAGYQAVLALRRLEEEVDKLGFMLCDPKTGWGGDDFNNLAGIKPKDDALPIYTRDAEIFRGTLEEIRVWVKGVHWAREYDRMLKVSDDKTRAKKEDAERARQFSAKQKQLLEELKKDHTDEQSK